MEEMLKDLMQKMTDMHAKPNMMMIHFLGLVLMMSSMYAGWQYCACGTALNITGAVIDAVCWVKKN